MTSRLVAALSGKNTCSPLSPVLTSDASISINISIRSLCASEDSRDISISISFFLCLCLCLCSVRGGAHDSTWIDGSSELFTFPKLYSILIANIASLALLELIYE